MIVIFVVKFSYIREKLKIIFIKFYYLMKFYFKILKKFHLKIYYMKISNIKKSIYSIIHTCDIHTVHELHTPSQQPVDDVLMQTLLWLHTALAHSVLL